VLGRTLDPLVALINMYKNRYGIVAILVSMFGGCSEGYCWRIRWVTPPMAQNMVKDPVPPCQQEA
jgi:hypothetical protein